MAGVWAWARADLRRRWGGVVFLAVLIGLVGAVTLTAVAGARRTATSLDRLVEAVDFRDAIFQGEDASDLDRLATLPFVERIIPVEQYLGLVEGSELDVGLLAGPPAWGRDFDRPVMKAGRLPRPSRPDEVMANSQLATTLGLRIGDSVTFQATAPDELRSYITGAEVYHGASGPAIELTVVGIGNAVEDRLDASGAALVGSQAFSHSFHARAGHFGGSDGLGSLAGIWLRGGANDANKLTEAVFKLFPRGHEAAAQPSAAIRQNADGALGTLNRAALIFALVTGVAGTLALTQALQRHLARAEDESLALTSLGLTRRQRSAGMVLAVLPAMVGGAIIAMLGAFAASPLTPFGLARKLDPDLGFQLDVPEVVLGAVVVVGVGLLVAGAVAWRCTRPMSRTRRFRLSHVAVLAGAGMPPALATGVRFSLEPGRGRATTPVKATLLGATLGVAGIVGAIAYSTSLDHLTNHPRQWGWTWDISFDLAETTATATADAVATEPGVAAVAVLSPADVNVGTLVQQAYALDVRSGSISVVTHAGRLPASPDEITIGSRLAARLRRTVGDTLTADAPDGPHELTVVGIGSMYTGEGALGDDVILTPAGLQAIAVSHDTPSLLVNVEPGRDVRAFADDLARRYPDQITSSAYSFPRPPPEVTNVAAVRAVPRALVAFFALLAFAGVGHALVTAARRRSGDLAILRALGFRPRQASAAIHVQAAVVSVIGVVAGIAAGLVAGRAAWGLLAEDVGIQGGYLVRASLVAVVLVLVLLVLQAVAVVPAHRAARVRPLEALRVE
jgi:FtsX-like permease family/MacB-like periplasmic core domain